MVDQVNLEVKIFLQDSYWKHQTKVRKMLTSPTRLNLHHWNRSSKIHSLLLLLVLSQVLAIFVEGPKYKHIIFELKTKTKFSVFKVSYPEDTGRKLNVYKTFNLRSVSTGYLPSTHPVWYNLGSMRITYKNLII